MGWGRVPECSRGKLGADRGRFTSIVVVQKILFLTRLICLFLIYMLPWSELQLSRLAHLSSCDNSTELHKLSCGLDGGRIIG
jgi:hypothetical protein